MNLTIDSHKLFANYSLTAINVLQNGKNTNKNKGNTYFFSYLCFMIGIYKITSPTKKVYIGQSVNIERRFKEYKRSLAKGQVLLNRSFLKYGIERHKFEIICECEITELNNKERYFQLLYSAIGKNGLNCILNLDKIFECKKEIQKRKQVTDLIDSIIF